MYLFIAVLLMLVFNCKKQTKIESAESHFSVHQVILKNDYITNNKLKAGKINKNVFRDTIHGEGQVQNSTNSVAAVSAPMHGILKSLRVNIGDYVKKGTNVAILENPEYVKLQQEYLETLSQFNFDKEDFKRQGELSLDNAASLKTLQYCQNEFQKAEVHLYSIQKQLAILGIDADSVTVKNLRSEIVLRAPISGIISGIFVKTGTFCTPETEILNMINDEPAILSLTVDGSNSLNIFSGERIVFHVYNNNCKLYNAEVISVLRWINADKSISLRAKILNGDHELLPGMAVSATIYVGLDSAYVIPREAIFKTDSNSYVFIKKGLNCFDPILIKTGKWNADSVKVNSGLDGLMQSEILFSGVELLLKEMKSED